MGERRKARYLVLRLLYAREITGESLDALAASLRGGADGPPGLPSFSADLLRRIDEEGERIDGIIQGYANRWTIERMPAIDRSLLRMGIAEILFLEDVPPGVTVNECVELAKRFSTEESGRFINGVLGHFIRDLEAGA